MAAVAVKLQQYIAQPVRSSFGAEKLSPDIVGTLYAKTRVVCSSRFGLNPKSGIKTLAINLWESSLLSLSL